MKKLIFSMVMAFMTIMSANAQIATENSKTFDNVYVTVNGGVATPLDFNNVFPLNGIAGLAVGKQFTPVVGAEIEGSAWFGSHANGSHVEGVPHFDSEISHNIVRGTYLGLNGTLNLTNWIRGYRGTPRTFEVGMLGGLGWLRQFTPNESNKHDNALGAKFGLDFMFNLGKTKANTISIKPAVLWNLSAPGDSHGNLAFNKYGAQLYIGVAFTHHFKTSNGTRHFKIYNVGAMMGEIAYLKGELGKKPKEIIKKVEVPVTKEVIVSNNAPYVISFAQGSYELTDAAKEVLDAVAVGSTVAVDATASPEGTESFNNELSKNRANAVADYLKNRGVNVESANGLGVTGDDSQRVARIIFK